MRSANRTVGCIRDVTFWRREPPHPHRRIRTGISSIRNASLFLALAYSTAGHRTAGLLMAPKGQESSQSLHWMHSSGVIVTRHLERRESCLRMTPYGQKKRQYGRPTKSPTSRKQMPIIRMLTLPLKRKNATNGSYRHIKNALPVAAKRTARAKYR